MCACVSRRGPTEAPSDGLVRGVSGDADVGVSRGSRSYPTYQRGHLLSPDTGTQSGHVIFCPHFHLVCGGGLVPPFCLGLSFPFCPTEGWTESSGGLLSVETGSLLAPRSGGPGKRIRSSDVSRAVSLFSAWPRPDFPSLQGPSSWLTRGRPSWASAAWPCAPDVEC